MLPPELRLSLSTVCLGLPGARWVDPGNFHVTIRFIGEIDEGTAADVDAALAGVKAPRFTLALAGMGIFDVGGKPRALYAGVEKSPLLIHLRERIESALARAGLPPEGRRFTPHVTLARFGGSRADAVGRFVAAHTLLRPGGFEVDRFQLIASYLTKSGSIYEDMAEYPLR
jgi:2'-5' RNA ligase